MIRVVAIDPGLTGAVAILTEEGDVEHLLDTPSFVMEGKRRDHDAQGMDSLLSTYVGLDRPNLHVYIEQQQMRPDVAVQATAKVWYGYGLWVGMLVTRGLRYTAVRAQTWQKEMYQGAVGEGKERSLLVASRLWPNVLIPKTRHDRADALLIAEYGRRVLLGKIKHWEDVS